MHETGLVPYDVRETEVGKLGAHRAQHRSSIYRLGWLREYDSNPFLTIALRCDNASDLNIGSPGNRGVKKVGPGSGFGGDIDNAGCACHRPPPNESRLSCGAKLDSSQMKTYETGALGGNRC